MDLTVNKGVMVAMPQLVQNGIPGMDGVFAFQRVDMGGEGQ